VLAGEQPQHGLEARLTEPGGTVRQAHVIDDDVDGAARQRRLQGEERRGVREDLQVPAERREQRR
jgi:hypothetical protein